MRVLLAAVVGVGLLLAGTVVGVAGTALVVVSPCSESYRLAVQPTAPPDDGATPLDTLPSPQRAAVEAAIENRTDVRFGDREALAALDGAVVRADDTHYTARVVVVPCSTPYDEAALAGYATGLGGGFLAGYALLHRRLR